MLTVNLHVRPKISKKMFFKKRLLALIGGTCQPTLKAGLVGFLNPTTVGFLNMELLWILTTSSPQQSLTNKQFQKVSLRLNWNSNLFRKISKLWSESLFQILGKEMNRICLAQLVQYVKLVLVQYLRLRLALASRANWPMRKVKNPCSKCNIIW